MSAAGYSGVQFDEKDLSLWMGDLLLVPGRHYSSLRRKSRLGIFEAQPRGSLQAAVHARQPGRCTFYTSDLTYEYVKLNADYTT